MGWKSILAGFICCIWGAAAIIGLLMFGFGEIPLINIAEIAMAPLGVWLIRRR